MNEHTDSNQSLPKRNGAPAGRPSRNGTPDTTSLDVWPFVEILLLRWRRPVFAGAALMVMGLLFGLFHWNSTYTAPVQLISYNSPSAAEVFGQREVSGQTLVGVLRSPDLLRAAGARANPPVSAAAFADQLNIMPDQNSEIIVATITDKKSQTAVKLANLYANEAVQFTQKLQAKSAAELDRFFSRQLTNLDAQIARLNQQAALLPSAGLSTTNGALPPSLSLFTQLQASRQKLVELLAQYTDAYPLVQAQRAKIAAIENLLNKTQAATNAPAFAVAAGANDPEVVRGKLEALEKTRLNLLNQRQAVQAFEANPPGFCRLLAPATLKGVVAHSRMAKVIALAVFAGMLGVAGGVAAVLLVEFADDRLKTASDVRRVTKLPVLAAGGDLGRLTETERYDWAFRTWTRLQGRLSPSPNHGLIFGVTSAGKGEGRSTWVNHLAEAASLLGFRVLTITTRPSRQGWDAGKEIMNGAAVEVESEIPQSELPENSLALTPNVLATPSEVTQKLTGPDSPPVVHIPLPGWVWNLERRKQWHDALEHWARIDNIVILVELPPASVPEAVLLAENLPNVVWLAASGRAAAAATREQLETLRHARCRLAGAVLNRAPEAFLKKRFNRWLNGAAILVALSFSLLHVMGSIPPETSEAVATTDTNAAAGVALEISHAAPERHYTLGAGDVLTFGLFDHPLLTQKNVPVGPDGRVSYLEAENVMAAGLTIDQLRAKMETELAEYRRAPHVIITPVAFNSKRYFLLGSVVHPGAFTLDQPTSIIEAIARAGGLATALQGQSVVDIADLQRAFLIRDGRRLPVDFGKLFQQGDLSQNIQLAPDDYLFIPPADLKQVYVVGQVQTPGAAPYHANLSALGAIAEQGGFTKRAWKLRVLVIRGSLTHPQTFVVDANDVLSGRKSGLKLEPNDIVYVHYRPWAKAEDIVNEAARAFVQSAVIVWTGGHVGPLIKTPIIE